MSRKTTPDDIKDTVARLAQGMAKAADQSAEMGDAVRHIGKHPGLAAPYRAPRPRKPPTRESQIEKRLVQRVKELGGEVRKVKWQGRAGAPDRLVMLPNEGQGEKTVTGRFVFFSKRTTTIWVELKAPGKKPEPHQVREHARMRKMGQRVEVVDSYERVEEILK